MSVKTSFKSIKICITNVFIFKSSSSFPGISPAENATKLFQNPKEPTLSGMFLISSGSASRKALANLKDKIDRMSVVSVHLRRKIPIAGVNTKVCDGYRLMTLDRIR